MNQIMERQRFPLAHTISCCLLLLGWVHCNVRVVCADAPQHPTTEPTLFSQMQNNQASLQLVMDRFGSDSREQQREAASAIVSLRSHYIEALQSHAESGFRGELSTMMEWHLLNALAYLRPTSLATAEMAMEHLNFSWKPPIGVGIGGSTIKANVAPGVIVFSSFSVLPFLAKNIGASPLPEDEKPLEVSHNGLRCALTIMGTGTAAWLEREAENAADETSRKALKKSAEFATTQTGVPDSTQGVMPSLNGFWPAYEFPESYVVRGQRMLDETPLDSFRLNWNAPDDLVKSANPKGRFNAIPDETKQALSEMLKPLSLIEYNLLKRIMTQPKGKALPYKQFRPEVQTDAIRVLGCMRSSISGPVIWERLRAKSRTKPLDQDTSEDTAACLRALGQIDVPVVYYLTDRIANLWAEDQQIATAYMLSKIMGRYSSFWIQREIIKYKNYSEIDKENGNAVRGYKESIKRLENALKVGKEKKWFEGEYYGYNDPHAYDLIFPDDKAAEAKPVAAEAKPPVTPPSNPFGATLGGAK